jgi:hypothetical protein
MGLMLLFGCAKKEDVVVQTGAGKELSEPAIDADPLALLPPNAIGVLTLDAKALFASSFGARLLALAQSRSPLPAAADFDAARDLQHVYAGFYSMQGADVAGVAIGHFQPEKIRSAADSQLQTATGAPVVKSEYAGRTVYTSRGVGMTVLTSRTVLFGDETGIRRALDRIHEGRAQRSLPKWMAELLTSEKAPIAGGADFTSQPVSDAVRDQIKFVDGLETVSLVGNFQDPGLNVAGTLVYGDPAAATRGVDNLMALHGRLSSYAPILAVIGIPQPIRRVEARAEDKQVRFVAGVDGNALVVLLEKAQTYLDAVQPSPSAAGNP